MRAAGKVIQIVGAGPSGLMASIAAAEQGASVTLHEQLDRPGAKLLASGGGRCNLTNTTDAASFMARFGRQGRFIQPALAALNAQALRDFLAALGAPTVCPDGLGVYPASDSAVTVQSALWRRCRQLGCRFEFQSRVTGLWLTDGRLAGVETGSGRFPATAVVLATGGKSYPELGGTGGGYELAAQAGHEIVEPIPALVPLVVRESWPGRCAGLSLPRARVWIDLPGQPRAGVSGPLLLTHRGLSGPAVLDISGDVARLLTRRREVPVRLGLSEGLPADHWRARFDEWAHRQGARPLRGLLADALPRRLAETVVTLAGIELQAQAGSLSARQRDAAAGLLAAMPLTVTATEGFARAMVTRGGVSLKQVDPRTLASRRLAGLFLAGELLDLDGPCGGYNLQWAFSSGWLAGRSAAAG